MGPADLLSYLAAAIASFGNALANVMQRKASLKQSPGTEFNASFLARLVRDPTWLLGFGGMVASFAFQAVALAIGELSAVETIITLEVPLTLLVASRVFGGRLTNHEWTAIGLMTVGMIALIAALDPQPGDEKAVNGVTYAASIGGTVLTIVVLIVVSRPLPPYAATACLGAAAGTSFGLTAALIKEVVEDLDSEGLISMLSTWQTYAAITTGLLGVLLMQWALHTGPLLAAQPGFTLMDPLVSILWGVLVYNEVTRQGGWLVLAAGGGVAIGAGVASLARSPLFAPDDDRLAAERRSVARADTFPA
ncbi:MAG TPA: DMT family transporter [Jatrophihabitantaceae bacterium]|nr:DMT family transporter [Jatrophihabitantaceae bacterium]